MLIITNQISKTKKTGMKHLKLLLVSTICIVLTQYGFADINTAIQWQKTIGGSGEDLLTSIQQTNDGGYILSGSSASGISGNKTQASKGGTDYWVVKLDALSNIE